MLIAWSNELIFKKYKSDFTGGDFIISTEEAKELINQKENEILKQKIEILEKENKLLKDRNQIDRDILELEKDDHGKTKDLLTNSDSVVKFLLKVLDHQDKLFDILIGNPNPIEIRKDQTDQTQGELLKLLIENEKLIKKQRARIDILEDLMKNEKAIFEKKLESCQNLNNSCNQIDLIANLLGTISEQENTIQNIR